MDVCSKLSPTSSEWYRNFNVALPLTRPSELYFNDSLHWVRWSGRKSYASQGSYEAWKVLKFIFWFFVPEKSTIWTYDAEH